MKRINLVMMMLTLCLGLSAQSMRSRLLYYLDNYTREEQNLRKSTLDSLVVDTAQSSIRVYANAGFKEQYFTDDVVSCIYDSVRSFVPDSLRTYRLTVFTDGHPIEQLVPNTLRSGPKDEDRMWQATYSGQPWVRNVSAPLTASKGLQSNHLAIMQSHGTYWKQDLKEWTWQRPHLFCTTEDLFSQTFVIPYIIPMLENAGAVVYSPRDRDWQNAEVIVDNDAPTKHGAYREEGHWNVCDSAGFAHLKEAYYMGDNPFRDGTARWAHTTRRNNHHAQITWTPDIPDDGQYAVYVSYQTVANSITDAAYTVVHRGVRTEFRVNQQMGGETWVYLGTFDFAKGQSADNCIELSNLSAEDGVVTADGIRLGSGRGNIARGAASADGSYAGFTTSGKPRWAEASMYYAQWAGMPDSVYNHFGNDNDYNNDMWARCETVSTLAGGSPYVPNRKGHGVPFELSVSCHTDAGYSRTGDLTGTLAICTALPDYYGARTDAGISRLSSYDLASSIQHNLTSDMKHWNWRIRQVWNRNYCETREPQIPSIILEMLSHQSFDDLCFGYNPLFKFDFSRSVYKSIVKYIAMMHKRSYVIQPLPVHNFAITLNDQDKWANLTWDPTPDELEPTATPTAYIVYTRIDDGDFDNGTVVKGTSYLAPLEKGRLYSFRVVAVNDGGKSFPSEVLSAYAAHQNKGTVLLVNAFTRLEGPAIISTDETQGFDLDADPGVPYGKFAGYCGRQITFDKKNMGSELPTGTGYSGSELEGTIMMGNTFDYVALHGRGIQQLDNHSFCSCSEEALHSRVIVPKEYAMIDVLYGVQKQMNSETVDLLRAYIAQGGRLLVSGANLKPYQLTMLKGMSVTEPIMMAVTDGPLVSADGPDKSITGVNGSNLDFTIYREMNEHSYAVPHVLSIHPQQGAFAMLQYSNLMPAAVAYDGQDFKSVVVGFPIESIREADKRNGLMRAITNFLCQ
ncbi:MAG: xanthan lyase [Bacteroidaceae bacterium]|nr:xanthan lyase [Bacteroidaceae bacterium]